MNRQDPMIDQLRDLIPIANREGMYDAADYLSRIVGEHYQKSGHHEVSSFGYPYCGYCRKDWPCPDAAPEATE